MATSRRLSIEIAQRALEEITARGLPAEPAIYEVFYAYTGGERPEIVRVVNSATATHGRLARADVEAIHRRFFGGEDLSARVEGANDNLAGEIGDVAELIDQAIVRGARHGEEFKGADHLLHQAVDHDMLRLIVATLSAALCHVGDENSGLGLDLQSAYQRIAATRNELALVREAGLTDTLTNLPNRRHFNTLLGAAIDESQREKEPFCLVLIDLDHFRTFNDAYGHQSGDYVLKLVAQEITRARKHRDVLARYGGEEFAAILPQTALRPAFIFADNLRRSIADKKVIKRSTGEELGRVMISAGVVEFRASETMANLLDRADACLYEAKARGRNCVVDEVAFEGRRAPMMRAG
jgi:diguanylate cyclase